MSEFKHSLCKAE